MKSYSIDDIIEQLHKEGELEELGLTKHQAHEIIMYVFSCVNNAMNNPVAETVLLHKFGRFFPSKSRLRRRIYRISQEYTKGNIDEKSYLSELERLLTSLNRVKDYSRSMSRKEQNEFLNLNTYKNVEEKQESGTSGDNS